MELSLRRDAYMDNALETAGTLRLLVSNIYSRYFCRVIDKYAYFLKVEDLEIISGIFGK